MRSRPHRHRDREEPLFARFTLWVLKSALGGLAFVLAGVALANYQVILHHDGQVEFVRKPAWTLADTFRFIGEGGVATGVEPPVVAQRGPERPTEAAVAKAPAPPPAIVVAAAPPQEPRPALLARAGVIALPAPVVRTSPPPPVVRASVAAPRVTARPVIARASVPPVGDVDEEEEDEAEPEVRAVLSTARPVPVQAENPSAAECRSVRAALARAVAQSERARGERMSELRIFDLIEEGALDQIVSCPSMGGLAIRRGRSGAEIRCTVHGPK